MQPPQVLAVVAWMAVAACTPHRGTVDPIAAPREGISIMVYSNGAPSSATGPRGETSFGVVDDRRYVDVTGTTILLDRIDPTVALPSLVIEPIPGPGGSDLRIGICVRDRIDPSAAALQQLAEARVGRVRNGDGDVDEEAASAETVTPTTPVGVLSPVVRCAVRGRPGRYLVRVLYVSPAIHHRVQHEVTITGTATEAHATIATRFALVTPAWGPRAEVALFDGVPGKYAAGDEGANDHESQPPREVAHGTVVLDGGTALLSLPVRTVPAKLVRVFDGGIRDPSVAATDAAWGRDSRREVWVWLELEAGPQPSGPVRVHVALAGEPAREAIVPAAMRERHKSTLRLPLWVDDLLQGQRRRWIDRADGSSLAERFQLSVSNTSETPREVWIEEHLRPAKRRELVRGSAGKPVLEGGVARSKVAVPPHSTEQVTFAIRSEL